MSPLETRAWFALWGMCPTYAIYFALQVADPPWLDTLLERIACLAATSLAYAAVAITGALVTAGRARDQGLMADERDRAIDAYATRIAYFVLMAGAVLSGMVMPFNNGGWKIVNAALLAIVLAEVLKNLLIIRGYRGLQRLAQ